MRKLTAHFIVNTPLFMGGADNTRDAELRPASLKSILRFWWRALAWSRLGGDLQEIHAEEARLFGSAEVGQGAFLLRMLLPEQPKLLKVGDVPEGLGNLPGARYLGYGVMEAFGSKNKNTRSGQLTRPGLAAPLEFKLELAFKRDQYDESIKDALKIMGLLGGAGSKARKGYGSLTLLDLRDEDGKSLWTLPENAEALKQRITDLLPLEFLQSEEPDYSAFSGLTRIDILDEGDAPLSLLNRVGEKMVLYRSWGKDGRVATTKNEESERRFRKDHDWSKNLLKESDFHPERIIFGLPHNYGKTAGVSPDTAVVGDRRSSPLFIHVHRYAPKQFAVLTVVLQSRFLPQDVKILANGKSVPQRADYQKIHDFLDGPKESSKIPYFPKKQQVFPA